MEHQDQVEVFLSNLGGHSAAPCSAAGEPAAAAAPQTLKRKAAGGDTEDGAGAVKRQCAEHDNVNALGEAYFDLGGLRRARSCRAGPLLPAAQSTCLPCLCAVSVQTPPRSVQVVGFPRAQHYPVSCDVPDASAGHRAELQGQQAVRRARLLHERTSRPPARRVRAGGLLVPREHACRGWALTRPAPCTRHRPDRGPVGDPARQRRQGRRRAGRARRGLRAGAQPRAPCAGAVRHAEKVSGRASRMHGAARQSACQQER